jgi:hypothetical protein
MQAFKRGHLPCNVRECARKASRGSGPMTSRQHPATPRQSAAFHLTLTTAWDRAPSPQLTPPPRAIPHNFQHVGPRECAVQPQGQHTLKRLEPSLTKAVHGKVAEQAVDQGWEGGAGGEDEAREGAQCWLSQFRAALTRMHRL